MFGIELSRSEWAALIGVVYLALRILFTFGRVVWWYVTDSRRLTTKIRPELPLLTGIAVAAIMIGTLAAVTDWPLGGGRTIAYIGAAVIGFLLGIMLDFIIELRSWTVSAWLMSFRIPQYRERLLHGDE